MTDIRKNKDALFAELYSMTFAAYEDGYKAGRAHDVDGLRKQIEGLEYEPLERQIRSEVVYDYR